jgi:hypothetical protein
MRTLLRSVILVATAAAAARAQSVTRDPVRGASLQASHRRSGDAVARFGGRTLDDWMTQSLDDSSVFRRDRANAALRRAPPAFRAESVRRFIAALRGPVQDRRQRALQALAQLATASQGQLGRFDGTDDIVPAVPTLADIARNPADALRTQALWLLVTVGGRSRDVSGPVARIGTGDSSASVRTASAALLGTVADAADEPRLVALLADRDDMVRAQASYALGQLPSRRASGDLVRMLKDPSPYVRAMALKGLASIGPAARVAVPAVAAMIADTTHWRTGNYAETLGAEAAWTASRIVPRRGISAMPARVDVDDRENSLRSDGLGTYVSAADSVDAFVSAALNLDLGGSRGDGRAIALPTTRTLRRSLLFDLSHPVARSGARPLAVVRDNEAIVHAYWSRVPGKRMVSVATLDPSDSAVTSQRTEFHFRIHGEPYLLQMGPWTEEEFNPRAPKVNGTGTSEARIWHPTAEEWTVIAPPGSTARLWRLSDPSKPVDLGLYFFSFAISWGGFSPVETMGTLSPR